MNESEVEILDYWYTLFPEIDDRDKIRKMIKNVSGKEMEEHAEEYKIVQKEIDEWVEHEFFTKKLKSSRYKEIEKTIHQEVRWSGFYTPILMKYYKRLQDMIQGQDCIKDKEGFLKSIILDHVRSMVNMSFRVLVLETQIAKNEKLLYGKTSKERGKYFCDTMLYDSGYLKELYHVYPELIRLLDQKTKQTYFYIKEILDQVSIFCAVWGKVENIILGKGDTHNNGKSVAFVEFEHKKIVYKPRKLIMEKKYGELLSWFQKEDRNFMKIDACKVWNFEKGGCMECIENEPCKSLSEIEDYYYRIGELLCILYTLNSKDFHCENLIAKGSMPILIDLETLLHTSVTQSSLDDIVYLVNEKILNSVIGISLMPTLMQNNNTEEAIEIGGIGSGKKQVSPYKTQKIEAADRDDIHIVFENKELKKTLNYPVYSNETIGCTNYLETIKKGFQDVYLWIIRNQELYLNKLEDIFGNLLCRVICKNTNLYSQLLETGYHPDLLHNPTDRNIYLCRLGLIMDQKNEYENRIIYEKEYSDLIRGDIPYFSIYTNKIDILFHNEKLEIRLKNFSTVLEGIEKKVISMGDMDLLRQLALINHSFIGSRLLPDLLYGTSVKFSKNSDKGKGIKKSWRVAEKIGKLCADRGFRFYIKRHSQMSWLGMRGFGNGFYRIVPVGFGLYQGNAGIALFFYKLAETNTNFIGIAKDAILPVINNLYKELESGLTLEGLGSFSGMMSELYSILYLYKNNVDFPIEIDMQYLIRAALPMVEREISENEQLDVLHGLAGVMGVLISMLSILSENDEKSVKRILDIIYQRIKELSIKKDSNAITWFENGNIGYAHGNSGIIVQLYRYYLIVQDNEVLDIIKKAFYYERKYHFKQKEQEWIFKKNTHYYSWCNGIGGLLLCKLFLIKNGFKDDKLQEEIDLIIEQLKVCGFGTDSCICHGDVGSLKLLEYAAEMLDLKELKEECFATTEELINQYIEKQWKNIIELEDWGLMTGVSGVGLGILSTGEEIANLLLLK
ncbi:type 2 lanthipeptide synthetase LanM [Anaerosacchariphilus polymeriproducens]|uniref:Type 2 lantipeptide synthetase LanM n=1 Tax=Anaerosacchariphilus polymeriproducens TaxID=1812858 RepID=A0A371AXK5_9FIRM|nr:type 2 lanthipeptide synthetase LanM [Anaerosacchariphilus polymeriproducens]RDU24210.1 type 2 lantipeptide synthetase LanM [Anaerosacchariphilus polymeriproducens]